MTLPHLNNRIQQLRLAGQVEPLHGPRLRMTADQVINTSIRWFALLVAVGVAALVVDVFRGYFWLPIVPVLLDAARWIGRIQQGKIHRPRMPFLYAPICTIWLFGLVLPALAYANSVELWAFCLVAFAGWRILRLSDKTLSENIDYAMDDPRMSANRRRLWHAFRDNGFSGPDRAKLSPPGGLTAEGEAEFLEARERLAHSYMGKYVVGCLIVAAGVAAGFACAECLYDYRMDGIHVQQLAIPVVVWTLPLLIGIIRSSCVSSRRRCLFLLQQALLVWLHQRGIEEEQHLAPWSKRSRYGRAEDRSDYLFWNILFVAVLLLPIGTFFPIYCSDGISFLNADFIQDYPWLGSRWGLSLTVAMHNEL